MRVIQEKLEKRSTKLESNVRNWLSEWIVSSAWSTMDENPMTIKCRCEISNFKFYKALLIWNCQSNSLIQSTDTISSYLKRQKSSTLWFKPVFKHCHCWLVNVALDRFQKAFIIFYQEVCYTVLLEPSRLLTKEVSLLRWLTGLLKFSMFLFSIDAVY